MIGGLPWAVAVWSACNAPDKGHRPAPEPTTLADPTDTVSPPEPTTPPCDDTVHVTSVAASMPHAVEHDRLVTVDLDGPAPVALLCAARDDATDRYVVESADGVVHHELRLQGLREDVTYDCAAGATCQGTEAAPFTIPVGPPSFVAESEVQGAPPLGWILGGLEPEGCLGPGNLVVLDPEGRLRWHWPLDYTGMDYEIVHLGDGLLLYGGHSEQPGPIELDLWDGVVWAADLPGDAFFHHDVGQLADGSILTLEASSVSDGGYAWTGFTIRRLDPTTWDERWVYDSQAGVDQGRLDPGSGDAWHANWFRWIDRADGDRLYVSLCESEQVLRIDVDSGAIDWVMGVGGDWTLVDLDGTALPNAEFPQCQHGLEVTDDETRMLVYDNGRQRGESRVMELALDQERRVATKTWEWTDGWFEPLLGDADWLPDGTVWVTEAHSECYHADGDRSEIVQVDPISGELWRLSFADPWMATYRSELLDGCSLFANVGQCPALQARWDELAPAFGF